VPDGSDISLSRTPPAPASSPPADGARPGDWVLNDGARAAIALAREFGTGEPLFELAIGGKAIVDAGLADDLAFCARIDTHDVVPVLHERSVTLHEPLIGSSS
jgi:2-phosphosulfolactate phosphatase